MRTLADEVRRVVRAKLLNPKWIEGWLEEKMGEDKGEFQGGAIDILTTEEVADWGARMQEIKAKLGS